MSVTTYFGRLSHDEYESMRNHPEGLAQFVDGTYPTERLLYLDKAAPVIAWLLSPRKRFEQAQFAAAMHAMDLETFEPPDLGPEPPFDELLVPIEGRGKAKDDKLDVGMGPACVLASDEVRKYSDLLQQVDEESLREQLDFQRLEDAVLSIDYWLEEGEQNFSEYVLPLFQQLQSFYGDAAAANQKVLVWWS